MDDQPVDARRHHGVGQGVERRLGVLIVDADPALHRHRHGDRRLHGGDAVTHQGRLAHQAGAEAALLHPVRGAADIQIDLVVAEIRGDAGGLRQLPRVRAAELDRHRVLHRREAEQPFARPVQHRAGGHHLGVEAGARRQRPVERPAVPVRPVHHRGDGEAPSAEIYRFFRCGNHLLSLSCCTSPGPIGRRTARSPASACRLDPVLYHRLARDGDHRRARGGPGRRGITRRSPSKETARSTARPGPSTGARPRPGPGSGRRNSARPPRLCPTTRESRCGRLGHARIPYLRPNPPHRTPGSDILRSSGRGSKRTVNQDQ